LAGLRDVSEGWFVDYKSGPLSAKDLGKHLSAFANQFGGWLFVGISEGPNKNLKAEAFPGIPSSDVPAVLALIREGASAHVSPILYFEYRTVDGPIDAIGLAAGRSIIVVLIPEAPNPPIVHSSGRIYRRIGDSSDPRPETDRAVLDAMWRKSPDMDARLRDFVSKSTDASTDQPAFCFVYLMEDLTLSFPEYQVNVADFAEAMKPDANEAVCSITLDNV
jgi:Putative DNA-binding domain